MEFGLISYNLRNGNLKYQKIFKESDNINFIEDQNNDQENDQNDIKPIINENDQIIKEYWIIKNNKNIFQIIISDTDFIIDSLNFVKSGPFFSLDEAKNVLDLLNHWNYAHII